MSEKRLEKFLTPLGVVIYDEDESEIKLRFGEPAAVVHSAKATNVIYYAETSCVNIEFLNGRLRGVIQEEMTKNTDKIKN